MAETNANGPDSKPAKEKKTKPNPIGKLKELLTPALRKKLLLVGVIAGGVLLGGAGGGLILGPKLTAARAAKASEPAKEEKAGKESKAEKGKASKEKQDKKEKKEKKKGGKEGESAVFKLENVIVNPAGTQGSRFLMATVAFECDDPKVDEMLRSNDIAIRDRVISVLENQTMEMLTRPGARDSIRILLAEAIAPFADDAELRVYLPQFVIQ